MVKKGADEPQMADSDEVLVERIRRQDKVALELLLQRYFPVIRKKASAVRLAAMDADDLAQEAYIGLLDAVHSFDASRRCAFSTYAHTCMDNRLKKAIAGANTGRQSVLNHAVNLDAVSDAADRTPDGDNPESLYIEKEKRRRLQAQIELLLSSFERDVLSLYLDGLSYHRIAERLRVTDKSVDNALQRIRRKLGDKS